VSTWQGEQEVLLADSGGLFPTPSLGTDADQAAAALPLRDRWEGWWTGRSGQLRDEDAFELLRALAPFFHHGVHAPHALRRPSWVDEVRAALFVPLDRLQLRHPVLVHRVMLWLLVLHPPSGAPDFLIDALELTLAHLPAAARDIEPDDLDWRSYSLLGWLDLGRYHRRAHPGAWLPAHHGRLWPLLRWIDEPAPGAPRHRPQIEEVLAASAGGAATEADLLDQLIGPRDRARYGHLGFDDLRRLTHRKPDPLCEQHPWLADVVERCRRRIVEVELGRGDLPTAAAAPALALRWAGGLDALVRVLAALGGDSFARGHLHDGVSRPAVFSHLVRVTFPGESDTADELARQAAQSGVGRRQLIETAVYAPQWAGHVERALGWPGLADAVWWLYAHTKDRHWSVEQEVRSVWAAQVAERTPLSADQLLDGAVDVAWFKAVHAALGDERWEQLYAAAKYAAGGNGHTRARGFADAMLGRATPEALLGHIRARRDQDAIRALGLVPLAAGAAGERDLLTRYQAMQDVARTGRRFGAQRQASERVAVEVGLANLARTGGHADPMRLAWTLEAREVADLADAPQTAVAGDVAVTLAIGPSGEAEVTASRAGNPLKAVPAQAKKDAQVEALLGRGRALGQQRRRMRGGLEAAMCRRDRSARPS
jgi:hypothetical protein